MDICMPKIMYKKYMIFEKDNSEEVIKKIEECGYTLEEINDTTATFLDSSDSEIHIELRVNFGDYVIFNYKETTVEKCLSREMFRSFYSFI